MRREEERDSKTGFVEAKRERRKKEERGER